MARIRSLKPEFWDDRKLARSASRDARMLYMGLWNQADEHCRLNGDEFWIKGRVFPYEDDIDTAAIKRLLDELAGAGRIIRYEVDGDPFIHLPKLSKHNRLEPAKVESRLPAPPTHTDLSPDTNTDADQSEPRADESAPDSDETALLYVPGSMDQVPGSMDQVGATQSAARATRIPEGWRPDAAYHRGLDVPDDYALRVLEDFRDYWSAKSGRDATKTDWQATWRKWLRKALDDSPPRTANGTGAGTAKARGWIDVARQLQEGQSA